MMRWIAAGVAIAAALGAAAFFWVIPARVDADLNAVAPGAFTPPDEAARALHASLRVADLHADTLLWMRDPAKRHARGHTDLPRLREGGVRLQVFSAVTKAPKEMNYETNTGDSDTITLLVIAQRWPLAAWTSLAERALHQARRLDRAAARSRGALRVVRSRADLDDALDSGALAGVLATEGAHPLEGDLANLDRLHSAGYRVLGLQHFFDNELGGSLHGVSGGGLTAFGRAAAARALELGMIIDVAHSSEAVVHDVLAMSDRPVIVSHTGFKGHCDTARNLPDALMVEIAARGGLIGVGFWDGAVCEPTAAAVAAAIRYGVDLVGAEHVALGSDFDGTITAPFDAADLAALTGALLAAGLDEATLRAVMGENAIRFFQDNLPE